MNLPLNGETTAYVLFRARAQPEHQGGVGVDQHVLAWRPTRRLTRRAMWSLWLTCLVLIPGALVLEHLTTEQPGTLSSVRAAGVITLLWLLLAWLWPDRARRRQMLAATLGLGLAVQVGTAVLLGDEWFLAARTAVAVVVQATVTLACYRWRIGDDTLTPHRPDDVTALAAASLVGALAAIPFGPAEGVWLDSSTFVQFWWTVPSAVYVFVGTSCVMLLVQRRPRTEAVPTRLGDVYVQVLVTSVCLGVVFFFYGLPLTWIILLPAVWAGLTMGPWTAAAYSFSGVLAVMVAQTSALRFPGAIGNRTPQLSEVLMFDTLMASFVFVVLLLSLGRDQRAHLASEVVRRRQQALDQAGLLGTVFESISEALVLIDTDGVVQLHNAAAQRILGPDRLTTEPSRWLRRLTERPSFTYAYNRDGSEDGLRVLAVQLAAVQYAGADSIVAIVRDVTTEQRRIEELASFAAVAAHDLKSPLTAVQGWIEVAEDVLHSDPEMALLALERGRNATDRMSNEIEDWLTYNVAREGVLQPERTLLQPFLQLLADTFPEDTDIVIETPDAVTVDQTLMRHLMMNLIGNAVKYTQPRLPPQVTVRSSAGNDPGWVTVCVSDSGIGIPDGEETAIFEPFRRASGVQGTYEGSGLGLALCKRIVRRHGGRISARRNEGPGTTVTVTLPRG